MARCLPWGAAQPVPSLGPPVTRLITFSCAAVGLVQMMTSPAARSQGWRGWLQRLRSSWRCRSGWRAHLSLSGPAASAAPLPLPGRPFPKRWGTCWGPQPARGGRCWGVSSPGGMAWRPLGPRAQGPMRGGAAGWGWAAALAALSGSAGAACSPLAHLRHEEAIVVEAVEAAHAAHEVEGVAGEAGPHEHPGPRRRTATPRSVSGRACGAARRGEARRRRRDPRERRVPGFGSASGRDEAELRG